MSDSPSWSDILIVGIPDYPAVILVLRSHGLPPLPKRIRVCDDLLVVASVVVRLDHRVSAAAGNVVDLLGEIAKVRRIRTSGHAVGNQALHVKVDPEGVETLCNERVIGRQSRPDEVFAVETWENAVAELRTTFVDANPLHLASPFGKFAGGSDHQTHRARCSENREEVHRRGASLGIG